MKEFQIKILASDKLIYEGPCVSVTVPLSDGSMGILAGHSNMVSAVKTGVISYKTAQDAKSEKVAVSAGLLKVENNEVLVLVDAAEKAESIDIARAMRAEESARAKLLNEQRKHERMAVEADLERAIMRIKASNMANTLHHKN